MKKGVSIVLAGLIVAALAVAETPTEAPVSREEIQTLQDQINALQAKLNNLLERAGEAGAPSAGMKAADSPAPARTEEIALAPAQGASRGLYSTGAAGQSTTRSPLGEAVKIGGYGSFRFESNNIDIGPRIGDLPPIRRGFNAFDFRRLVLTADAAPSDRLRIYSEIEFERFHKMEIERTAIPENLGQRNRAGIRFVEGIEGQGGSELKMEQAWAQYDFARPLRFRMGVILPPVGRFNIHHDDDYWDLPRRPLVDRGGPVLPVAAAWSDLGAGLVGNQPLGEGYLDYQFYVMGGTKLNFSLEKTVSLRQGRNLVEVEPEIGFDSGPFNGTNPGHALGWRMAYSPKAGNEVALSGYHGRYTPDFLNVKSSIHTLGFDGKLSYKRFELEGEFVFTDFGRMEGVLRDIAAQGVNAAAETSSGEAARLETEVEAEFAGPFTNQRYGYWVDLKYRFWPRFLNSTFLGRGFENPQLIPIVRFERIWFNDFVREFTFSGGNITALDKENLEQQRISVGLTYRPTAPVAFTAAYEHNQRIQGSTLIFPRVTGLGRLPDKSYDALTLGVAFGF